MTTMETIVNRIYYLCEEKGFTPNGIATYSAVPQSTVKSILNGVTLGEFFSTPEFDALEQEIK